jgi:hypothetical protein
VTDPDFMERSLVLSFCARDLLALAQADHAVVVPAVANHAVSGANVAECGRQRPGEAWHADLCLGRLTPLVISHEVLTR